MKVAQENGQTVDIARMAEKASRKARRRLRRKLAIESFTKAVQIAVTPNELLSQVLLLENSIPPSLLLVSNRRSILTAAETSSEVGLRLYALDRSIAYQEIHGLENASQIAPVKLRVCFALRCHLSPQCTRFLGHGGKCTLTAATFSRLPDQFQFAPPNESSSAVLLPSHTENSRKLSSNQVQVRTLPKQSEEFFPKLATFSDKDGVDIETITPWVPLSNEIGISQWI
jgi:hypothetical protein